MRGGRWRPQAAQLAVLFFLVLLAEGCGKKAPPQPPVRPELPRVQDLEATAKEGGVQLTWSIPSAEAAVAGFKIYRSQLLPGAEPCPSCPREYGLIESVEVKPEETDFRAVDRSVRERGRFYYRVVPYDERNRAGPESNEAEVVLE